MKILNIQPSLLQGGIEYVTYNLYRHFTSSGIQYIYLIKDPSQISDYMKKQIETAGGIVVSNSGKSYFSLLCSLWCLLKTSGPYTVIQVHTTTFNGIALAIAWCFGIKKRFSFIHIISIPHLNPFKRMVQKASHCLISVFATRKFACSYAAGKSVYLGKFQIFNNAIDTQKFKFNPQTRTKQRKLLNVEDKFVIAQTARFSPEKNHTFSLLILEELLKKHPRIHMVFMGDGVTLPTIQQQAKKMGIEQHIIFLGAISNVHEVLQAADAFILPSTWEALGMAAIEAQGAGLPCVLADNIPQETFVINAYPLPLKAGPQVWADKLLEFKDFKREDTSGKLIKAGFDIKATAAYLQEEYFK